jgi:hypothetical protein
VAVAEDQHRRGFVDELAGIFRDSKLLTWLVTAQCNTGRGCG